MCFINLPQIGRGKYYTNAYKTRKRRTFVEMNVPILLKGTQKEEEPSVTRGELVLFLVQRYTKYCDEEKEAKKTSNYTDQVKAQGKKKIMLDIGRVLGIKINENFLEGSEIGKADNKIKVIKIDEALGIVRGNSKEFLSGRFSNSSYITGYEETLAEVQAWADLRKSRRQT